MKWIEYRFDSLPSTQDFLQKKRSEGQNMLAVASVQTTGKGTKGRRFECGEGGLWLSALVFHENAPAKDAFLMMSRAAVAVCKTLESYGLTPQIKWANDVLLGRRKVCGILTENELSGSQIRSTLWGIGLNVNNSLSDELAPIATTVCKRLGKPLDLREVEERLLENLLASFSFEEYRSRMAYLGEEIPFVIGEQVKYATLLGVNERGELLLEEDGKTVAYPYGEISFARRSKPNLTRF